MSINLPDHYTVSYSTNIMLLLQQKGSKLRGTMTEGSYTGKQASVVDQFGAVEMQQVTSRFAPKTYTDASVDRRWVVPTDFDLTQRVDTFDKLRLLTDPESSLVQGAVFAAGRKIDRIAITAFQATAMTGVAGATGPTGATGAGLTVGAIVNPDGSVQYASAGVTVSRTGTGQYSITIPSGTFQNVAIPMFTPLSDANILASTTNGFTVVNVTFSRDTFFHFLMIHVKPQ